MLALATQPHADKADLQCHAAPPVRVEAEGADITARRRNQTGPRRLPGLEPLTGSPGVGPRPGEASRSSPVSRMPTIRCSALRRTTRSARPAVPVQISSSAGQRAQSAARRPPRNAPRHVALHHRLAHDIEWQRDEHRKVEHGPYGRPRRLVQQQVVAFDQNHGVVRPDADARRGRGRAGRGRSAAL